MKKVDFSNEGLLKENFQKIDDLLAHLTSFLDGKQAVKITNKEFVACYDFAFNASSHDDKVSAKLFDFYHSKCKDYAGKISQQLSEINSTNENLLKEFNKAWENTKIFLRWMIKIFTNLDRFYLNHLDKTLCYSGFKVFVDDCFINHTDRITALILQLINKERDGEYVSTADIKKGIKSLNEFGCNKDITIKFRADKVDDRYAYDAKINPKIYNERFQKPLIDDTSRVYTLKSHEWQVLSVPEYVHEALKKLAEEEKIAERYYPTSQKVVITAIEDVVIVKPCKILADNPNTGITAMFAKGKRDQLKDIYTLFKRAESETIHEISVRFGGYIEQEGASLFEDADTKKDPLVFANKVLALKTKVDDIVQNEFDSHMTFQRKRDIHFQQMLSKFDKSAQFFAVHSDFEFKKGLKGLSEEDIDKKFTLLISILSCLSARDAFLKHYSRYLSSRLLNNTSINNEAEKQLIEKLCLHWGHLSVMKIKAMLQDIDTSKEINQQFQSHLTATKVAFGVQVDIQVLTRGCWPENEVSKVRIPAEMQPIKEIFEKFYQAKYAGKVLTWLMNLGETEVNAKFDKKYSLLAANYQYVILELFNRKESYTFDEIMTQLEMTQEELTYNLLPLCLKVPLLHKQDKAQKESFKSDETVTLNTTFTSQAKRLVCKPHKAPASKKNADKTDLEKDIIREREFQIDACIIRIMKSRRILDLNSIQSEIKKLITLFNPEPTMIKRRIESLMERDYLKRDDKDKHLYVYLP